MITWLQKCSPWLQIAALVPRNARVEWLNKAKWKKKIGKFAVSCCKEQNQILTFSAINKAYFWSWPCLVTQFSSLVLSRILTDARSAWLAIKTSAYESCCPSVKTDGFIFIYVSQNRQRGSCVKLLFYSVSMLRYETIKRISIDGLHGSSQTQYYSYRGNLRENISFEMIYFFQCIACYGNSKWISKFQIFTKTSLSDYSYGPEITYRWWFVFSLKI